MDDKRAGYADIAAFYRQEIAEGRLKPGERLPTRKEVGERFKSASTTVNRAFQMLKNEGLILSVPGSGTLVAARARTHQTGEARLRRLERTGNPYAPGEVSIAHQAALRSIDDVEIAELLDMELREEVIVRTRVFVKDDMPTVFATSVIHPRALIDVPELLSDERLPKFWQKLYAERTGETIIKGPEQRGARLASQFELGALGLAGSKDDPAPVLVLRNVFYNHDGPIEVWEDVYTPGTWQTDSN